MPVLLAHGGPGHYDYLEPVASMLSDLALVHRYDQRGGGRSASSGPWTISALVADIEALRSSFGHARWIVGGHSWGAHLVLFYALAFPERVLGLVLLNGPGLRWGWGPARRAARLPRLTPAEREEVERLERDGSTAALERLRDLWWITDFASRDNALRSPPFTTYARDPSVVSALERDWEATLSGIESRLGALSMPSLVLHGEADPMGEDGPRELACSLPDARFVVLPGVGHLPWLEDPTRLRSSLREFITQLRSLVRDGA
ncbi:MAG TPA: alpha/beta hydrolase [Thermoleophilaceae bacterium]|nr:alpha/beta hydrolase [Thermoleophilaceae bacterium]